MCSARVGSNPILVADFYSPFLLAPASLFPFFSTGMHKKGSYSGKRARPGFEPGTSRTLSENHTPRPTSHTADTTGINWLSGKEQAVQMGGLKWDTNDLPYRPMGNPLPSFCTKNVRPQVGSNHQPFG